MTLVDTSTELKLTKGVVCGYCTGDVSMLWYLDDSFQHVILMRSLHSVASLHQ